MLARPRLGRWTGWSRTVKAFGRQELRRRTQNKAEKTHICTQVEMGVGDNRRHTHRYNESDGEPDAVEIEENS